MKQKCETYEIVVVGGGLAGFCAAVAAARHGAAPAWCRTVPSSAAQFLRDQGYSHGAAAFHAMPAKPASSPNC